MLLNIHPEIMTHIRSRLTCAELVNLSITCTSQRREAIQHMRRIAMSALSTLYAELPVRGPMFRAHVYETELKKWFKIESGLPRERFCGPMSIIIRAFVNPKTLRIVVNTTFDYPRSPTEHFRVIAFLPNGDTDVFDNYRRTYTAASELVQMSFHFVHKIVAAGRCNSQEELDKIDVY